MVEYPCSIIADPNGKTWQFAQDVYNVLKQRDSKFELNEERVAEFRDGEMKPKIKENIRKRNCFFIHDSSKRPDRWFTELCLVNKTLRSSSAQHITDVLPYLRYGRQDRKDESRVPNSCRVVADVIGLYANGVLTMDVHNPSIDGCYDIPFDNLYSFNIAIEHINKRFPEFLEDIIIVSPDAGGAPRAQAFAKRVMAGEIAIGYKRRIVAGDVESIGITGEVDKKNCLIVDDIIDSGGTLLKACESLKKNGARLVAVYATHGLFTKGTQELVKNLEFIVVSNTLSQAQRKEDSKISVIDVAPLFAEAIYRINEGNPLSKLFE